MVTVFSNDSVSRQTKIKSLQEEIKSLKNENSNLKGDIKTQPKVTENLSRFENRQDFVTTKDKVNVNYKYDNHKNEIHRQIPTSRNKYGHFTNTENILERNRKSNGIHFELGNRFSPLHNDDQNLRKKRPISRISNIPEKMPAISRNPSPVQLILHLYVTLRIFSKISYLLQFQGIVTTC